jgi:hypothetical protein
MQTITSTSANLRHQTERSKPVGRNPARHARGHPLQRALLQACGKRLVEPSRGAEGFLRRTFENKLYIHRISLIPYFFSALTAERSVNSIDSRGMLSTYGRTTQPRPLGIARVSDTASICR